MGKLQRAWQALTRRGDQIDRRVAREIDEELSFHLEMRTRENLADGMSAEEAERQARQRLGALQPALVEQR